MDISPTEAEEALAAIQTVVHKTQRWISSSGAYAILIIWGLVWLLGFLSSHFLPDVTAGQIWIGLDIVGGIFSAVIGSRMKRRVRSPSAPSSGKRIGWFWLFLFLTCAIAIGIARPADGKQLAMLIILFVMIGWMAMSFLLSFLSAWLGIAILALALIGYYFLGDYFYLWMGILGGGGMIVSGIYIRNRW